MVKTVSPSNLCPKITYIYIKVQFRSTLSSCRSNYESRKGRKSDDDIIKGQCLCREEAGVDMKPWPRSSPTLTIWQWVFHILNGLWFITTNNFFPLFLVRVTLSCVVEGSDCTKLSIQRCQFGNNTSYDDECVVEVVKSLFFMGLFSNAFCLIWKKKKKDSSWFLPVNLVQLKGYLLDEFEG